MPSSISLLGAESSCSRTLPPPNTWARRVLGSSCEVPRTAVASSSSPSFDCRVRHPRSEARGQRWPPLPPRPRQ
jgi:hypothetical protein